MAEAYLTEQQEKRRKSERCWSYPEENRQSDWDWKGKINFPWVNTISCLTFSHVNLYNHLCKGQQFETSSCQKE